jgi:uncharacterized membrane protein YebE (DUF533 family)
MSFTTRDAYATSSGGIGIGTTTAKARSNAIINYAIDGTTTSKASTDDLWTLGGTALAANQACVFWLLLDAAGTSTVTQSAINTASTAASGYVAGAYGWPQFAGKVVVGAILVKSGGSAFTPGTTALTSVATYFNQAGDYGKPITF